jgi:gas vesicle protein
VQLPALLAPAMALETFKVNARRVDGRIIGTGEADFTKGNSLYTLYYKEKTFQLLDVPGIEGDESKYEHMIREAVAKAHLVFYINGTNKKPEKATAEKIRSYLRRGTQVCPIVNMRGSADAYEFEEDRKALEGHGGAGAALQQTMGVLETVLGKEVLLPGRCVQGLLAFSSLAINPESRSTSIHPSRNHDLVLQQRNYLKHFTSAKTMFEFSQIKGVAQILHAKLGTFKGDIVESNKVKVSELLAENIINLQEALKNHQTFMAEVNPEFEKCRESINGAFRTFERLVSTGRRNLWSDFFNNLSESADQIVADHFGDNDLIAAKLKKSFQSSQEQVGQHMQEQFEEHLEGLQSSMSQAMVRLIQDVHRVEFQQRITFDHGDNQTKYRAFDLDMALGLKGWGSIAFSVGSYAATGAGIGSPGGPPGIAIGAAIGAVVGILVSVMHFFTSKEKRIRKAQAQAQEKIDELRNEVLDSLDDKTKSLVAPVRKEIRETALSQVDTIYAGLARPLDIIQQQLALMAHIKKQLEKMPHGTIQAIQR